MRTIISKSFEILNKTEKRWICPIVILMLVGAGLETMSVTVVIPLVTVMMNPEQSVSGGWGSLLSSVFHVQNGEGHFIVLTVLLIVIFIVLIKRPFTLMRNILKI